MAQRIFEVPCEVDIEQTPESFHAHAIPEMELRPGDVVVVHDVPTVGFGGHITMRCRATVTRAGWLDRMWTQTTGLFEITGLYEVGFEAKEA